MSTFNQNEWPRISIVTPSYNQGRFIEQTIRSVVEQDYPNLEYIIIDGGSNDETLDIIRQYETHLSYWVSEKDQGAADALSKGFERATGAIFAYLNSDDVYLPGTLGAVGKRMRDTSVDVVYGNLYWIDIEGQVTGERRHTRFTRSGYLYGESDLTQPSTFWTGELYRSSGGINPSYHFAFDTDLFYRFAIQGARFGFMNRFLASFRIHPQSKSTNEAELCLRELDRLRREHLHAPFTSFRASCIRNIAKLHRTFWYAAQGDLPWLIGRLPARIRAKNSSDVVGPGARRL